MLSHFSQFWTRFQSLHRSIRISTYLLFTYLIYALTLGVITPYVLKQELPKQVSGVIERPVTVQDIRINPFTLQFDVQEFVIWQEEQPFIKFELASAQVNFWDSLFNGAVVVEYVLLEQPFVDVVRLDEQSFNFTDILTALEKQNSEQQTLAESESAGQSSQTDTAVDRHAPLFPVVIHQTKLTEGQVTFSDEVTGTALNYPSINFALGEFSTQATLAKGESNANVVVNDYWLSIVDQHSGEFSVQGNVQLKPLEVVGSARVSELQLPQFWGFIEANILASMKSAVLNVSSDYHIKHTLGQTETDDVLAVNTNNGQFSLSGVNFEYNQSSIVSLSDFSINDIQLDTLEQTVNVESVVSDSLKVSTKVDKAGVELVRLLLPTFPNTEGNIALKEGSPEPGSNLQNDQAATETTSQPWLLALNGIELTNYSVAVTESLVTDKSQRWVIAPINISTSTVISDLSKPVAFDLFASVNERGDIKAKGMADLDNQNVKAHFEIDELQLAQFQPYIETAVNATLSKGSLSTQVDINADANGQVFVTGGAQVDKLSIRDNKLKKPFVKWGQLAVDKFQFDLQKSQLAIETLSLNQPYARVVINEDRTTNLGELVIAQSSDSTDGANKPKNEVKQAANKPKQSNKKTDSEAFKLSINQIVFNDGSAFFADNSLTPNFSSGIEQLEGKIGNVSSVKGTKATVDIRGNIDRYAPVRIQGEINPLLEQPYLDLDVLFNSVELTTVNPYSGTYAGHYIDKGQLTLALNYQLEKNKLTGSNHIVIDQLQLGQASESDLATSLPLELAIALLQDRNGVIDLGVEVTGDVDDPEFGIGSVVLKTLVNIIEKAVTAPFSFIAGLAGSDEELNVVDFESGSSELTSEQQDKLVTLGEALASRPMLTLSVDGAVEAQSDSKALAEQQFHTQLAKFANMDVTALPSPLSASTTPTQGALSEALISVYKMAESSEPEKLKEEIETRSTESGEQLTAEELNKRWHIAMYNLALNAQEVSSAELGQLAQKRAATVKAYLVESAQVDASRVFLLDSRFDIEQDTSSVLLTLEAK
ncbi:DUF748 domain-containing protein [Vibrio makurazakiensis]|uniref:DUF748 domain-containing protein n=1 Tax=Vibrio makurazakiensis TaxID=2910250 RepID=UPI003D0E8DB8